MANLSPQTSQIRVPIRQNPNSGSLRPVFVAIQDGISDARTDLGSPLVSRFGCHSGDTAVLAGVADCPFALRAHEGVLDTSCRVTALHAAQSYCPTFDSPLAGTVAFRNDPNLASELLDWHGGGIICRSRQRKRSRTRASRC